MLWVRERCCLGKWGDANYDDGDDDDDDDDNDDDDDDDDDDDVDISCQTLAPVLREECPIWQKHVRISPFHRK